MENLATTLSKNIYGDNLKIAQSLTPFQTPQEFHTFINYMAAVKYLENKGLKVNTSKSYLKRGSIGIVDPLTNRQFSITINGYIRTYKIFPGWECYGKITYQLNPQNTSSPIGYSSSRVLFPKEYNYMAILLWKTIKRIRKNS